MSASQFRWNGSENVFCVTGCKTIVEPLVGRLPDKRALCAENPAMACGNKPDCVICAEARACSSCVRATSIVWFAAIACFSYWSSSGSPKIVHQLPLGMESCGVAVRHGGSSFHVGA